jgi:hypothetical protein
MSPRNFTSESGRAAQVVSMAGKRRDEDETFQRANAPDLYTCPYCGETLSGPPRLYTCPNVLMGDGERRVA